MSKNRRSFLKTTLATGVGLVSANALGQSCDPQVNQPEGPFYPLFDPIDTDADLTLVRGSSQRARGQVVILKGKVQDQHCQAIEGALVDIWQACHTGKYNHPSDPNPNELDPNFQYWAKVRTNKKGEFRFRTIKPGAYQASGTWLRPPHIHMKFQLRGYQELTTQIYWADEAKLNEKDLILRRLGPQQRKMVTIDFSSGVGVAVITLEKL